ncbi:efflux RND transporter periplasmic adaptor subunit [Paenibacillus thalictri]|uniref:Efflux RND transporter periplasmic adaptor subunit n=1 Tax=Paenibacillus thalictri TaxID=2527873 RepID=A0A4Q9DSH6_9BACL|nr:efflux RND transporter periplasmic adaptor subunit [Paenibacillus thalictri]TBL78209.1 efflux RND transporter periplasmic adaptor subunit [Paenibacillus thalictri]
MNTLFLSKTKQTAKWAAVILLSSALAAGCTAAQPPAKTEDKPAEVQLKTVKVSKIEKQKIGDPIEQVADVASSIQMDVVAKGGGDILEILKKRGDYAEQGEVLVKLDPTDVQLSKEKAAVAVRGSELQLSKSKEDLANSKQELKNGIAKTEASLKDLEKTYNKMKNDYDLGLVTKIQLEQTETQLGNMRLDIQSSQDKLKTLESTNSLAALEQQAQSSSLSLREADRALGNLEIKAPTSGVITDLPIDVGMTIPVGFKVAQMQKLDPIKIKAELTEATAQLVRGKSELTFYVPGSVDKTKGKISYLSDVMGSQKSYSLELEVPNQDKKLKPGMKAQVQLTEETDQVVVSVPTLSVVREGGDTFVYILNGDTVERRKVSLGRLNETVQEVTSGVKEGEQLVVSGQHQLKDKEKVQLAK